jgi:nitroreductase
VNEGGPWRKPLEFAILAPSPHNVQPWRVRIRDDTRAELLIERARTLPNEDTQGSFLVLTMGMFLETLRIAAAHQQFAVDVEIVQGFDAYSTAGLRSWAGEHIEFARLILSPAPGVVPEYDLDLIRRRRTSRLPFHPTPVAPETTATLTAIAERHGHRYAQTSDPKLIERILEMNIAAVFEDLNHAPYRNELRSWLRYSAGQSLRHRDGLDARCMNQHPAELWTAFHAGWLLRFPVTRPWIARRYRSQIGPVPTMGFLCGPFWAPRDAFFTGQLLMRFWLECTRLGYYFHPYGNLVTNRPWAARLEATTGLADVWLAFKIGQSDTPPASCRRSLEEILID